MLRNFGKLFDKIESGALIISLAVMVVVIFAQVVMRYVFGSSLAWSEEFARYMFVWFSWMGVSAGLKDGEHLSVKTLSSVLVERGFTKSNEILNIFVSLVWLITTLIVSYYGFQIVAKQVSLNVLTPAMRLPIWIGYLSVPACSAVVGIRLIVKLTKSMMVLLGKSNRERDVTS